MKVAEMVLQAWQGAEDKGFHEGTDNGRRDLLLRLCLIHTEVSEAAQIVKRHWPNDPRIWDDGLKQERTNELAEELADILIRVGDFAKCAGLEPDELEFAVKLKMAKNAKRPHRYGTPGEGGV